MKPVEGLFLEIVLLGQAFLAGIILCFTYDLIRILRRLIPHGRIAVIAGDLLYLLLAAGWLFLEVCQVNYGIIRGYMVLGTAAGAGIYYGLCGRILMKILTKWIRIAQKRLKSMGKAVTMRLEKFHRNQETENEEKEKKTP